MHPLRDGSGADHVQETQTGNDTNKGLCLGRGHPSVDRMADVLLALRDRLGCAALVPMPIQVFRGPAELDHQVFGEILWFKFPALFPPQSDKIGFILAHNDAGIRAADERAALPINRL